MKRTEYFSSNEELENYYPDGVPNNVLAIVSENNGKEVLFTSSNNQVAEGEAQGGYNTAPEDLARISYLEENKADKSEIPSLEGYATEAYVMGKGFLTEHQDLSNYALKSEIPSEVSLEGYATEAYVMSKGFLTEHQSLSGYATESYVNTQIEAVVGAAPAALDTLKEIGDSLNNDADFAGTMTTALAGKANANDVYTKQEIDNAGYLTSHQSLADYVTKTDLSNASYLTQHQSLSDYPTKAEISAAGYLTSHQSLDDYALKSELPSLNGYATETWVGNQGFLTQHQSLSDYPTKAEISAAGYLTSHQSLSDYVTKTELSNASYLTQHQSLSGYATESYVATYVATYAPTPDLTNYVTKNDLSGCGYITSQVKADWNQTNSSNASYIKNKPAIKASGNNIIISNFPDTNIAGSGGSTLLIGQYNKTRDSIGNIAAGMLSYALGTMSIASGFHVRTNNYCETAFGNYNQTNTANSTFGNAGNTHFSIGIGAGSNDYDTKNAIEVMQNGDLYAYGVGNYDGTNYTSAHTLAYVINDIQTTLGTAASVASLIVGE